MSSSPAHTIRPSVVSALLRAWRTRHEHERLLPTGPASAGPWAGRPDRDTDAARVRADLRAAA